MRSKLPLPLTAGVGGPWIRSRCWLAPVVVVGCSFVVVVVGGCSRRRRLLSRRHRSLALFFSFLRPLF